MNIFKLFFLRLSLICMISSSVMAQTVKMRVSEGYASTKDSVQLFYKIMGEGKDTLVVVHGGPYNSSYLSSDLTPLASHHTLIYYDQRGTGFSTVISDTSKLSMSMNVQDLETIRQYFKLQKLNILAHSTGGIISGFYAVHFPEKIRSMILVNPMTASAGWSTNFNKKLDSTSLLIKNQNAKIFYGSPTDSLKACWDYYALVARGYYPSPVKVRRMWGDVCNSKQANMLNPNKWYIYQSLGNWDITAQLAKVKAPVLIIAGEEDEIPFASFEQWNKSLPNSTLFKIPNSAHFPHVDQPNAFFTAVESFIQNKKPDESMLKSTGAGVILPGDDTGTSYQKARAAVIRVENELVRLLHKGEWDSVAAIYAIDATILPPGTSPIVGRQAISSFWHTAAIRGMSSIELQLMDLEISGELLIGKGKYQMNNRHAEIIDIGKFIAIYRKENNTWILQTDMFNSSLETRSPIEVPDYLILQKK
jgi:proline iminopeptidase